MVKKPGCDKAASRLSLVYIFHISHSTGLSLLFFFLGAKYVSWGP